MCILQILWDCIPADELWGGIGQESKKLRSASNYSLEYAPGLDPLQPLDILKRFGLEDWDLIPSGNTKDLQVEVPKYFIGKNCG